MDIRGDPYGLLAAHPLAPLVSLHHLDYFKPLFPTLTRGDSLRKLHGAYQMDPGRTLQHSFCYDLRRNWSVSVAWGYTLQLYPSLLAAKDLEQALQTFQTWKTYRNEPFTFNTRPVSADPCQRPIVYFLDRVERVGKGRSLTTYKRYKDGFQKVCERVDYAPTLAIHSFNVSASQFNRNSWNKVRNLSQIFYVLFSFFVFFLIFIIIIAIS